MNKEKKSLNFIEQIIEEDLAKGLDKSKLRFRFPPEPNGYLHIGHAASICLNFGLGLTYNAPVNLRFDDTNPAKEEQEYVDAIKKDIQWLGFEWDKELYSSDYFQQLYDWALQLIKEGKAYIDNQTSKEMAIQKGTPTEVGTNSPNRNRSIEENLELFLKMKNGELDEGSHILRAKIDMTHNNMHMRDPIMYRILKKHHHRTGNDWCIYPMYDWTHGESDYIEQISHSICTLEFKSHRVLYDWYVDQVCDSSKLRPKQREFARRNLSYTVMSKRKLLQLVEENIVSGWDDPRMPTISGLRRRGYTAKSIRDFSETAGISKRDNIVDIALLEFHIKNELNKIAPRVMAVLDPVKVIITNYPENKEEILMAENNPEDENAGSREVPFSREIYIEKEDFREQANKKFFRLKLDKEVRLKNAYIIKANSVVKDKNGEITEIHCTYDEDSKSGSGSEASKRKVKGTIHWVSIKHAEKVEVRLYDRLFTDEAPDSYKDKDFKEFINPDSLKIIKNAYVEPSLKTAKIGDRFQFQRIGYFNVDYDSNSLKHLVFNKIVDIKETKRRINKKTEEEFPFKEIVELSKKYLQGSNFEKRRDLENVINNKAEKLNHIFDVYSKINSRVDKMAFLMLLNSINFKNREYSEKEFNIYLKDFLKSTLEDKNTMIIWETLDFLSNNNPYKNYYSEILSKIKRDNKNEKVQQKLKLLLN